MARHRIYSCIVQVVKRDLLRGYKKGEDVPMPSPERRKEIDKMIEDIFK